MIIIHENVINISNRTETKNNKKFQISIITDRTTTKEGSSSSSKRSRCKENESERKDGLNSKLFGWISKKQNTRNHRRARKSERERKDNEKKEKTE